MIRQARASGAPAARINAEVASATQMKEAYKNPVVVVAYTYLEILPIALIVPVITALVLKKKENKGRVMVA